MVILHYKRSDHVSFLLQARVETSPGVAQPLPPTSLPKKPGPGDFSFKHKNKYKCKYKYKYKHKHKHKTTHQSSDLISLIRNAHHQQHHDRLDHQHQHHHDDHHLNQGCHQFFSLTKVSAAQQPQTFFRWFSKIFINNSFLTMLFH